MSFFSFFPFEKKDTPSKRYSLRDIPLFEELSDADIAFLDSRIRLIEYKKNSIIYKQFEEAKAFYIIMSGRCRVYVLPPHDEEQTIAYLHRGDYFGEVSLLSDKKHTATVETKNDTMILQIEKDDFYEILKQIPSLSMHISRILGTRIRKRFEAESGVVDAKIVAVYNVGNSVSDTRLVLNMAANLVSETKRNVLVIDLLTSRERDGQAMAVDEDSLPAFCVNEETPISEEHFKEYKIKHKAGYDLLRVRGEDTEVIKQKITTLLIDFIPHYNFIIVNLPQKLNGYSFHALVQSDLIYLLTDSRVENIERARNLIDECRKYHFTMKEIRLIFCQESAADMLTIKQKERMVRWKIFSVLPALSESDKTTSYLAFPIVKTKPSLPYCRAIRYLSRELGGVLVGLALGSGAAYGLAHIGVLKVLEEKGIDIDVVAGSSIGSVIGGLWASGYSAAEIENIALSFSQRRNLFQLVDLFDISAPHFGFLKGRAISRFLRKYLGKKTFADMKIPLRIVATNLITSEDVVFKEGCVVDAIRASISIPGIFKPVTIKRKYLIDGGVTNPLPVNTLYAEGVSKIIAVNVLPTTSDILETRGLIKKKKEVLNSKLERASILKRFFFAWGRRLQKKYIKNIFNVLMNTVQYLESTVARMQESQADIAIRPIVPHSHWAEFYAPKKFIAYGEAKTREVIDEIRRLVEE